MTQTRVLIFRLNVWSDGRRLTVEDSVRPDGSLKEPPDISVWHPLVEEAIAV